MSATVATETERKTDFFNMIPLLIAAPTFLLRAFAPNPIGQFETQRETALSDRHSRHWQHEQQA
jgi:hypothetical protein